MENIYYLKYIKYKNKYLDIINQVGGKIKISDINYSLGTFLIKGIKLDKKTVDEIQRKSENRRNEIVLTFIANKLGIEQKYMHVNYLPSTKEYDFTLRKLIPQLHPQFDTVKGDFVNYSTNFINFIAEKLNAKIIKK